MLVIREDNTQKIINIQRVFKRSTSEILQQVENSEPREKFNL